MMQEVKNTANTVILISSGTVSGKRSRQVAQSELYARALEAFGGIGLLDCGSLISHFRNGGSAETTLDRLAFIQFSDVCQDRISSIRRNSSSDSPGASNARRFSRI